MTRTISSACEAAASAGQVRPVYLVRMDFDTPVLVNSSPYTITYDSEDYVGVGGLGAIDAIQEGAEMQAYAAKFTMSGIPPEYVSIALGEHYQGNDVKLYQAFLDEDHALIDATLTWNGRMDTMDIEMGETATITVTAESYLVDWDRRRISRYNNADQQSKYPGDKGFEFVEQMVEKQILWGR